MVEMGQQTLQAPRFVGGVTIVSGNVTWGADGAIRTKAAAAGYIDLQSHNGSAYASCIKLVGGVAELAACKLTGNVNGNSRNIANLYVLAMTGYLEMVEITKPDNPGAGRVYIYPKDKGSNITGLFALFDDGTEVEIATEV